jgi:hypothetical protein
MRKRPMTEPNYPDAIAPDKVGDYDAFAHAGGGYTWDAVLEYRVWMHPERSAPDEYDGNDYYFHSQDTPRPVHITRNTKAVKNQWHSYCSAIISMRRNLVFLNM